MHRPTRAFLVFLCSCAAGAISAGPLSCPAPDGVALGASADGWRTYIVQNAYDRPRLTFNNMRIRGDVVMCQYDVGEGTVRLQTIKSCVTASGKWEEKGSSQVCLGPDAGACTMECKP